VVLRLRQLLRARRALYIPLPRIVLRAYRACYLGSLSLVGFVYRILVCQPLFRASCTSVGKRLRLGTHVHWVRGPGRILIGDDVTVDGKCVFQFAYRFSEAPTLSIGDRTMVGHETTIVVAHEVSIGSDCLIASRVHIFDTSGHPLDPTARLAGLPQSLDEIKPVRIGNNVWIGTGATICPGVTIGDGAVIAAQSVVVNHVASYTLVAGYPARKVQELKRIVE
jgi:acetyltransferase-like isoleucine patch superfamily enzyme